MGGGCEEKEKGCEQLILHAFSICFSSLAPPPPPPPFSPSPISLMVSVAVKLHVYLPAGQTPADECPIPPPHPQPPPRLLLCFVLVMFQKSYLTFGAFSVIRKCSRLLRYCPLYVRLLFCSLQGSKTFPAFVTRPYSGSLQAVAVLPSFCPPSLLFSSGLENISSIRHQTVFWVLAGCCGTALFLSTFSSVLFRARKHFQHSSPDRVLGPCRWKTQSVCCCHGYQCTFVAGLLFGFCVETSAAKAVNRCQSRKTRSL